MNYTPESFAALLHGRQYRDEMTQAEHLLAHANGLLVVYGASDDLCEFEGVFRDECGACGGKVIKVDARGIVEDPDRDEREVLEKFGAEEFVANRPGASFGCLWDMETPDGRKCSWHYKADFPHVTFDIMEDGELYCQGIVFRLEDALKGKP